MKMVLSFETFQMISSNILNTNIHFYHRSVIRQLAGEMCVNRRELHNVQQRNADFITQEVKWAKY
jgi:hypothetical protein